jgi:hypothetical protein
VENVLPYSENLFRWASIGAKFMGFTVVSSVPHRLHNEIQPNILPLYCLVRLFLHHDSLL